MAVGEGGEVRGDSALTVGGGCARLVDVVWLIQLRSGMPQLSM